MGISSYSEMRNGCSLVKVWTYEFTPRSLTAHPTKIKVQHTISSRFANLNVIFHWKSYMFTCILKVKKKCISKTKLTLTTTALLSHEESVFCVSLSLYVQTLVAYFKGYRIQQPCILNIHFWRPPKPTWNRIKSNWKQYFDKWLVSRLRTEQFLTIGAFAAP